MSDLETRPFADVVEFEHGLYAAAVDNLASRSLIGNGQRQPVSREMAVNIVKLLPFERVVEIAITDEEQQQ